MVAWMKKTLLLVIWSLLWLPGRAATPAARPDVAALDRWFQEQFDAAAYPGLGVVMVHEGRTVYARGFGVAVVGADRPLDADTPVGIGSLTKSLTTLCLMRLVDQGRLDLDRPVTDYLADFRTADRDQSDRITVRMLLSNSSGLPSMDRGILAVEHDGDADLRLVESLAGTVLNRPPGSGFEYCNEGFVVAGRIAAALHGKPFSQTLHDLVLQPLGMTHASADPEQLVRLGGLHGHYAGATKGLPAGRALALGRYNAAGSVLQCSATDLGRYLNALLTGRDAAGQPLLAPALIDEMWRDHVLMPESERLGSFHYGLGWMVGEVDGRRVAAHGGHAITMTSFAMLVPAQKTGLAVTANIETLDAHRFPDLPTLVNNGLHLAFGEPLSDFGKPQRPDATRNDFSLPAEEAARYVGRYQASGLATTWLAVSQEPDGALSLAVTRDGTLVKSGLLDFMNPARAYVRSIGTAAPVFWRRDAAGTVHSLRYDGLVLLREQDGAPDPVPSRVGAAGFSMEPAADWQVVAGTQGLTVARDAARLWAGALAGPVDVTRAVVAAGGNAELSEGPTSQVTVGRHLWHKVAVHSAVDGRRHLVLWRPLVEQTAYWVLTTEADQLTRVFQQEGRAMLKTLVTP